MVECYNTIAVLIYFLKSEVTPDVRKAIASETAQQEHYEQALLINFHVPPLFFESLLRTSFCHACLRDIDSVLINRR
jgi:hypothetical protein